MADDIYLSELQRDAITELLNIGMGRAAAALSEMVSEEVHLSVPSVEVLSRTEAAHKINGNPHKRIAAVRQHFQGPFWGDAILLFPQEKSLELVRILLREENIPLDTLTELERDALTEVGNIILNSCLSSLGDMLNYEVTSHLPVFITGTATEVLENDNTHSPQQDDVVMFLRMDFALRSKDISGYVAFILEIPSIAQFKLRIDQYLSGHT
jgi:chemotaxis protein CheC